MKNIDVTSSRYKSLSSKYFSYFYMKTYVAGASNVMGKFSRRQTDDIFIFTEKLDITLCTNCLLSR